MLQTATTVSPDVAVCTLSCTPLALCALACCSPPPPQPRVMRVEAWDTHGAEDEQLVLLAGSKLSTCTIRAQKNRCGAWCMGGAQVVRVLCTRCVLRVQGQASVS